MKSILITGGAGFIGSHTCLALLEKGYEVFVVDSFQNSSRKALNRVLDILKNKKSSLAKRITIFNGDLRDKKFLENVFLKIYSENNIIDGIIHFAGVKSVFESVNNPFLYWQTNVLGTINLLEMYIKYECKNFVFSSSATIYAQTNDSLLRETSLIGPINPYGNSKLCVEKCLEDIFKSPTNNHKFASLRYFNPIGAHCSGLIGEDPRGITNNIFPKIVNTAMGLQKQLKIYGNDWHTKDGTPIRDYIHVMDLAEAHIKILDNLIESEPIYLNLNIGTGIGTSVLDLVKTFEKVNNVKVPHVFTKRRIGDAAFVVADNSLSKKIFNIFPKRNIEDMCRDGWKWKKLNPNGYL